MAERNTLEFDTFAKFTAILMHKSKFDFNWKFVDLEKKTCGQRDLCETWIFNQSFDVEEHVNAQWTLHVRFTTSDWKKKMLIFFYCTRFEHPTWTPHDIFAQLLLPSTRKYLAASFAGISYPFYAQQSQPFASTFRYSLQYSMS